MYGSEGDVIVFRKHIYTIETRGLIAEPLYKKRFVLLAEGTLRIGDLTCGVFRWWRPSRESVPTSDTQWHVNTNADIIQGLNPITASESVTVLGLKRLRRSTQPKGKLSLTDNNLELQEVESLHTVCLPPDHLGTTRYKYNPLLYYTIWFWIYLVWYG